MFMNVFKENCEASGLHIFSEKLILVKITCARVLVSYIGDVLNDKFLRRHMVQRLSFFLKRIMLTFSAFEIDKNLFLQIFQRSHFRC